MKKLFLLSLMAFAFLTLNATVYTLDLQSGSLTKGTSDSFIVPAWEKYKVKSQTGESIINENRVWMSGYEKHGNIRADYQSFHGTETINEKEYHKLYETHKIIEDIDVNYNEKLAEINAIPDFDFDNMKPKYYIRQDGQKYYMLLAHEIFNEYGEMIDSPDSEGGYITIYADGYRYEYGSNITETLIYDFSVEPGGYYYRCEYPGMPKDNIFGFPEKGYYHWECYGHTQPNLINVIGYNEKESCGKLYKLQYNQFDAKITEPRYNASPAIGSLDGNIAAPGFIQYPIIDSSSRYGLVWVRTIDGEYIYGEPFKTEYKPVHVEMTADDAEATVYYGIDGRQIYGDPAPGIYIERRGKSVRKIVIK